MELWNCLCCQAAEAHEQTGSPVMVLIRKSYEWHMQVQLLSHTDDLINHPYDITIYLLHYSDVMWMLPRLKSRHTCEISTNFTSYGRVNKSSVWCRKTVALSYGWYVYVKSSYEIATHFISYGRVSKSYVWDMCTAVMSCGWDDKSSVW